MAVPGLYVFKILHIYSLGLNSGILVFLALKSLHEVSFEMQFQKACEPIMYEI